MVQVPPWGDGSLRSWPSGSSADTSSCEVSPALKKELVEWGMSVNKAWYCYTLDYLGNMGLHTGQQYSKS